MARLPKAERITTLCVFAVAKNNLKCWTINDKHYRQSAALIQADSCLSVGGLRGACVRSGAELGQAQPKRARALPARHARVCSDAAADPPLHHRCH